MIVDKIHDIMSFGHGKWLEKYISFYNIKRNKAENGFEKNIYNLFNNAFDGKTMENVRNWIKLGFNRKDDKETIMKQQSKLPFNGTHKFLKIVVVTYLDRMKFLWTKRRILDLLY